ncbi:MAG TPA: hypothetical protein VF948_01390 [Methylomirabilota bacterium]
MEGVLIHEATRKMSAAVSGDDGEGFVIFDKYVIIHIDTTVGKVLSVK